MEFCPTCANMLRYEPANVGTRARLFCPTCPYICKLENEVVLKKPLRLPKKSPIESVDITASNERAKELAPKAEVTCPKCKSGKAYFEQHQTRSADEPMTIFYRCCNDNCKHQWRED